MSLGAGRRLPRGQEVAGVSPQERQIIRTAFSNPLEVPPLWKGWLEAYLEPIIDELVLRRLSNQAAQFTDEIANIGLWQSFTPVWSSSGTAPAIGNGTITGRYTRIGKTIHFEISIVFGSTTTFGTGNYAFSLPASFAGSATIPVGLARGVDTAVLNYIGEAIIATATTVNVLTPAGALWTPSAPFTWGNGDIIGIMGTYEEA